ncbi:MAG: hypothetical protein ACK4F9_04905 [Brevinematia bacterium]
MSKVYNYLMIIGCGKFDMDTFLINIEKPSKDFLEHINHCDKCKTEFVEIKVANKKMSLSNLEPIDNNIKYGRILLKVKEGLLEIIDALSGVRYGAKLAFRGDEIYQTKKEVIYESEKMKVFVNSYDANELVLSVRIKDYGEITVLDSQNSILRSTTGKSGLDVRIKTGKYIIKHDKEEIMLEVEKER